MAVELRRGPVFKLLGTFKTQFNADNVGQLTRDILSMPRLVLLCDRSFTIASRYLTLEAV